MIKEGEFQISNFKFQIPKGFTLIELLVVISVIGMLATFLLASFRSTQQRARDSQRKSDLKEVKTALALYYSDYGYFPANNGNGEILGCGGSGTSACAWGGQWCAGGAGCSRVYMNILPIDPINAASNTYRYTKVSDDSFTITALLENSNDTDATKSQSRCASGSGLTYVACQD